MILLPIQNNIRERANLDPIGVGLEELLKVGLAVLEVLLEGIRCGAVQIRLSYLKITNN